MLLQEYLENNAGSIVNEAIRSRDIEKAINLISSYLVKRKIYTMPTIRDLTERGKRKLGVIVFNEKDQAACFVWDLGSSAQIESVLFTGQFHNMYTAWRNNEKFTWEAEVQAKGANTVQMCKLVGMALSENILDVNALRRKIQDAQLFESLVVEAGDDLIDKLKKDRSRIAVKLSNAKKKGDTRKIEDLQAEYDEIAKRISDARLSVKPNVTTQLQEDPEVDSLEDMFEEELKTTPEERFQDMEMYVNMVLSGRKPFAVLCGAPGVGKSFRVMQAVKQSGLEKDVDYFLLKAKSSPQALYTKLHDFKSPGQIIIMDDCDDVFKDGDSINILKAAYDSSDERWISWNTARKIPMDPEEAEACDDADFDSVTNRWYYPRQFLYEGGGILITNYRAGQIDTAIRNRALICDLEFTPDEIIDIIEKMAPKIEADKYSMEAKEQAIEFLRELNRRKVPINLSIRSFITCVDFFAIPHIDMRAARRNIITQMRNQSASGGKKY